MTDSRALDADRLPWLTNDTRAVVESGWSPVLTWGVTALLLVAGVSYWAGRTTDEDFTEEAAWVEAARETIKLPAPAAKAPAATAEPRPVVVAPPQPKIEPVPPPAVEVTRPEPVAAPKAPRVERVEAAARAKPKAAKKATAARPKARSAPRKAAAASAKQPARQAAARKRVPRVAHWPTPAGAVPLGRIIRIGVYSTPEKNHKAWQAALQRYPQMRGLPKIIGIYRDRYGRTQYPLYIMTTARAQSDWLCRRMRRAWRSCTVIG